MSEEKKKTKNSFLEMRENYKAFCKRHHMQSAARGIKFGRQGEGRELWIGADQSSVITSNPSPE